MELAEACARGDGRAWAELLRRYDDKVRSALRRAGAREDADDLRQDVWARLLADDRAALRRFRAGSLRVFIAQVARRVAIDHGRAQRRRPPGTGGEEPAALACGRPGPLEALGESSRRRQLAAALDSLTVRPGRQRDILRLHFEEGLMPAEIAGMGLGLSARGVESLLRRARRKLTALLAED